MEKEDEEMKRLTVRIDGSAYCLGRYQNKHCNVKRCGCCEINDEIIKKLADYEDTGMTPEQVIEMQMDWVAMKATYPKWIPVTERLPEEHDSIFTKFKGQEEWKKGMFAKVSVDVLVTIKCEDGEQEICTTAKTRDGEWKNDFLRAFRSAKVIAWMPFPKPYKE